MTDTIPAPAPLHTDACPHSDCTGECRRPRPPIVERSGYILHVGGTDAAHIGFHAFDDGCCANFDEPGTKQPDGMTERELDYERRIANQAKLIGERTRERDAASRLAAEYKESQVKLMRTLSQVQAERTAAYAERDELARKLEGAKAEGRREAFAEGVTEAQRDIYRWSGWYGFFKWLREKAACR